MSLAGRLWTFLALPTPGSAPALGVSGIDAGCRTKSTMGASAEALAATMVARGNDWLGREDLNLRPLPPEGSWAFLTSCIY